MKKKSASVISPARAARIKRIERMAASGTIKTSLAILAKDGARPVNKQAVNVVKHMGTGSQVTPKRPK